MRLTRRGYKSDHGEPTLVDQELAEDAGYSSHSYPTGSCGFDGEEFILGMCGIPGETTHWCVLSLTPEEMRILLSRSLEDALPDSEKELWETLFDLWEKRLTRRDRKRS